MQDLLPWINTEEQQKAKIEELRHFLESDETNPFLKEKFVPLGCQFLNENITNKIDDML